MNIRYCERISTEFPVIFASESWVGEGTVLNVSVPGCEIRSKKPVEAGAYLEMKVLLPDHGAALCVGLAKVRWSNGHRFGVEFIRMPGEDQVRLGRLVKQHCPPKPPTRLYPARMLHW
jgi:PilZ domain